MCIRDRREGRKTPHQTPENEYRWHESTVAYILEYMEYTGCTVNFKTYTNSIWDKKQRENPCLLYTSRCV